MAEETRTHGCSQEITLNTICLKLENIEKDICEIKTVQNGFMERMEFMMVNSAKYPPSEVIQKSLNKLDRHEIYFKVIWGAFIVLVPVVLFLLDKTWLD